MFIETITLKDSLYELANANPSPPPSLSTFTVTPRDLFNYFLDYLAVYPTSRGRGYFCLIHVEHGHRYVFSPDIDTVAHRYPVYYALPLDPTGLSRVLPFTRSLLTTVKRDVKNLLASYDHH